MDDISAIIAELGNWERPEGIGEYSICAMATETEIR